MKYKSLLTLLTASALLLSACDVSDNIEDGAVESSGEQGSANGELADTEGSSDIEGTDTPSEIQSADVQAERIAVAFAEDNSLVGWGLGRERDSLNRPVDAVNAQKKYGEKSALFIDPSGSKTVYLTFDEGYENGYTASILDTLKETGVKAAFFVTYDYCKNSPELVERMIREGHIVGNHSYSHPSFPKCTDEEVKEEITLLHEYVKDNFNYEMTLFRFPMGEFSEKTLSEVQKSGYTSVFWSFAYKDWNADAQPSSMEAYNTVTNALHSGGIYLLHAVSKANAESLGDIISYWKQNGYTVGDLEQLAKSDR